MMLEHFGAHDAGRAMVGGIERVLAEPKLRTRALGGSASTLECGKTIAGAID